MNAQTGMHICKMILDHSLLARACMAIDKGPD